MSGDFVLTVALSRPGRVLMLKARRDAEKLCLLPEGWRPIRYDVTWFYWGGTGPDADNALASCKAYLDGCADALGVNDRVLDCAGIHRVKDRQQDGTVLIRFYA